ALHDLVLPQGREPLRWRKEAASQIGDDSAAVQHRVGRGRVIAARRRKARNRDRTLREQGVQLLLRLVHGIPLRPRFESDAAGAFPMRPSFARRYAIYRLPPRWRKPRSSTDNTRIPKETFARMGLSAGSNASSVTLKSVMRTGTIRCELQTNSVSADCMGTSSIVPRAARASLAISAAAEGYAIASSVASCG